MNDLHNQAPCPSTATQTVELIGGAYDGDEYDVPPNCIELSSEAAGVYRYCPHASARFDKPCFIHQDLDHDLYAR